MIRCVPDYYDSFRCLAQDCPHSCCEGWEVVVDEETAAYYQALPGELGDRLRAALSRDGEDYCFPLHGGRCPFWEQNGLCEIHRRLGEERTSYICRTHPRFFDDYCTRREETLGASCPAVARMVLSRDAELLEETLPGGESEESPALLPFVLACRRTAIAILRQKAPLAQSLAQLLIFANDAQFLIDTEETDSLDALTAAWTGIISPIDLPEDGSDVWRRVRELLLELEILGDDWRKLLEQELTPRPLPQTWGRRTAEYFIHRFFLHSAWDRDLLSRAELVVLAVALIGALGDDWQEHFRVFCREMEHCQENLDALQDAFCQRFSVEDLLKLL